MPLSLPARALLILAVLNLLDYLDRYLIASLGSLVKSEMGLSDRAFGFLGTAFFLVYLLSSPIFGYLGDRYGRLKLMAGGAVLWSLATSLTYWVASYPMLVLTRGLVRLGLLEGKTSKLIKDEAYKRFYMHRTSHWLGLDVHDAGDYKRGGAWRTLVAREGGEAAARMLDELEDNIFFSWQSGFNVSDFEKTWFEHGGLTLQPCLLDTPIIYMARDEIARVVRSIFRIVPA